LEQERYLILDLAMGGSRGGEGGQQYPLAGVQGDGRGKWLFAEFFVTI